LNRGLLSSPLRWLLLVGKQRSCGTAGALLPSTATSLLGECSVLFVCSSAISSSGGGGESREGWHQFATARVIMDQSCYLWHSSAATGATDG